MSFDPYHKWLGIRPEDQPPDHYRLLGIDRFEDDPDVIDSAADQRMAHLRSFQNGKNAQFSQQLLNEVSAARVALLDPNQKAAYDGPLREATLAAEIPADQQSVPSALPQPAVPKTVAQAKKRRTPPWVVPAAVGGGAIAVLILVLIMFSLLNGPTDDGVVDNDQPRTNPQNEAPPDATIPPPPKATDLLSEVDVQQDSVEGQWQLKDGQLVSPLDQLARIQLAKDVPDEYVLTIEVVKKSGGALIIGLIVEDHRARVEIDSWNPPGTGLCDIDRVKPQENETWREGRLLESFDETHSIVCTVRRNHIVASCNNREVINWKGDPARLTDWVKIPDPTRLYIASFEAEYHFSKIELTPLQPRPRTSEVAR